jgi:flagellar basal-body rod protein FlgB
MDYKPTTFEISTAMVTNKLRLLANAMQAYSLRAQTTASNLANLDTPGYKRMSVKFEESLQNARNTIDGSEALARVEPSVDVQDGAPILEDELMEFADTQMRTQLVSRALQTHFDALRTGITGHSG